MRKHLAGLLLFLGLASPALAQSKFTMPPPAGVFLGGYQVVATCGAASGLIAGNLAFGAMDTTGAICTNGSGGGGTTSSNITQFGGTNISTGTGVGGAGIPRVTVSSDSFPASQVVTQSTAANLNATVVGTGTFPVQATITPSSSASIGITPVVSAAAEATHVLKASAGNAYSVYANNLTATTGFLVLINATSAPADGAITPLACAVLSGNGIASIQYAPGPPAVFSTGITAVVTSGATCFTKTTGVITAYISGMVQ